MQFQLDVTKAKIDVLVFNFGLVITLISFLIGNHICILLDANSTTKIYFGIGIGIEVICLIIVYVSTNKRLNRLWNEFQSEMRQRLLE